ncbi:response regulator transcription factor [Anaerocolumna sp. AGMB13025]|uniref:response regulator transcription factor n=1 Tax=Anaerocolumna sp. AGMB13025 TaxID=3039116 RepID=UPI00241DD7A8|nr:response regulator transcription factor [Anaerocolumna sp. AGMB13025]WFR54715.1 response regulator transcription factor [Anaerocolumna sp. AGMB13025]
MAQILVVEDNPDYLELLQNFLENAGYTVTTAQDGVEALVEAKKQPFDLVLLDIMLPKIDGYGVCEVIRKESNIPIIMLTALEDEAHQVRGFDLSIDDYITKPVSMTILLHKVAAVLRRSSPMDAKMLVYRTISLDINSHTVSISGNLIDFTLREFEILQELLRSPGEVVTRKKLLATIWSYDFYGDERIIDTHIKNIRRKLGDEDCIETIRGLGYKLQKET